LNPSSFGFPKGLGNLFISTNPIVDTFGASSLIGASMTHVTQIQPLMHTSPFAHGLGNIPASLFPHMCTPSDLLGCSISHMIGSQVVHTTTVIQATQPPSHTSQMSKPYIESQFSMGGQLSSRGKHLAGGNFFTGGKPKWLQHQQA
jgi:hypothetical protein